MTDVLVVDDDIRAARRFASFIENSTKLKTIYTSDPMHAIELVQQHDIKTVVLDQRMPIMTGTQLFAALREQDNEIRGILFSGQADMGDLSNALELEGGIVRFVDKNNLQDLPELVREKHEEYLTRLASRQFENPEKVYEYRSGFSFRGEKVSVELLSLDPVPGVGQIWIPEQFRTVVRLNAGATERVEHRVSSERQIILEDEMQSKVTSSTQGSAKAVFSAPIKLEIASQARRSIESSARQRLQASALDRTERILERTHTLDAGEVDKDGVKVRLREIQEAPTYLRYRAVTRIRCSCCGIDSFDSSSILFKTGDVKIRHIDHLDNGDVRTINL